MTNEERLREAAKGSSHRELMIASADEIALLYDLLVKAGQSASSTSNDLGSVDIELNCFDEYEVIRVEPVVIGRFDRREYADLFYDAVITGDAVVTEPPEQKPDEIVAGKVHLDRGGTVVFPDVQIDCPGIGKTSAASTDGTIDGATLKEAEPQDLSTPNPDPILSPEIWEEAFERIQAGERVTDVAADMDIPFQRLRAKWAAAVKCGTHQKPEPKKKRLSKAEQRQPSDGDDTPVSGGIQGVLERGTKARQFTEEQDTAILEASPDRIATLAKSFNRSVADVSARKTTLERQAKNLISGDKS